MDVDSATGEGRKVPSKRLSFSLGNLLMLVALIAVSIAWWGDRNRSSSPPKYDIPGPISVSYKVRTSPSSTSGGSIGGVKGINYRGNNVIVYTESGGAVLAGDSLIRFTWVSEVHQPIHNDANH